MKTIGEAILHFRTSGKKRVSQRELGRVIGRNNESTAQSTIRYFETGTSAPTDDELKTILEYLGATKEEFDAYRKTKDPIFILEGSPIHEKIFDIWPEGIELFHMYNKACNMESEDLIINIIDEMTKTLKTRSDDYKKSRKGKK